MPAACGSAGRRACRERALGTLGRINSCWKTALRKDAESAMRSPSDGCAWRTASSCFVVITACSLTSSIRSTAAAHLRRFGARYLTFERTGGEGLFPTHLRHSCCRTRRLKAVSRVSYQHNCKPKHVRSAQRIEGDQFLVTQSPRRHLRLVLVDVAYIAESSDAIAIVKPDDPSGLPDDQDPEWLHRVVLATLISNGESSAVVEIWHSADT